MKWPIFVCSLVCLARYCEAGALRCPPGVIECTEEKTEIADTKETSRPSHSGSSTECLVGTEWESKCHTCRCTDAGLAQCSKVANCEHGVYEEPYLCKANTTFLRDCNKCLCLDNGLALCSMEYCADRPQVLSIEESDESESTENSDTTDAVAPVVIKHYKDNIIEYHGISKRSTLCKPHEEFLSDCNPCRCSGDGHSYTCTHNECLEGDMDKEVEVFKESEGEDHIERHSVCRARNTFYIGCNTCHCNSLGTDYTCTNRPCPLPADVELFHELRVLEPVIPYADNDESRTKASAL